MTLGKAVATGEQDLRENAEDERCSRGGPFGRSDRLKFVERSVRFLVRKPPATFKRPVGIPPELHEEGKGEDCTKFVELVEDLVLRTHSCGLWVG